MPTKPRAKPAAEFRLQSEITDELCSENSRCSFPDRRHSVCESRDARDRHRHHESRFEESGIQQCPPRVASWWRAAICLIGDIWQGLFRIMVIGPRRALACRVCWAIGIAAVMGHCWSPFLGFNGGKGVATTFGVLLASAACASRCSACRSIRYCDFLAASSSSSRKARSRRYRPHGRYLGSGSGIREDCCEHGDLCRSSCWRLC